jgi:uncharacterized protein (TIGR00290 family)
MKNVLLSWSSGKDSAWALQLLRQDPAFRVKALVTTFNTEADRVAMHAVRRELVRAQAERTGLPLWEVELPWPCPNATYEEIMGGVCRRARGEGIDAVAFGDLFLEDIRAYRLRQLAGTGLEALFPVWGIPTSQLAHDMIRGGLRTRITCVDSRKLAPSFAGREFDLSFLADLPQGIDPCGENGEFHTFVWDAPVFAGPIPVESGVTITRDGFVFADIIQTDARNTCHPPIDRHPLESKELYP